MSKRYEATITFLYWADEPAPLTGKPINNCDDAIQAVRDELEEFSPYEFNIECREIDL
jgi:hypothetical protein